MNFKPKFVKKSQASDSSGPTTPSTSVTKYMATDLITFKPETEIRDAIALLLEKKITGAPVLNDQNEVIGLIDDKDCLRVLVDSVYHNQPLVKTTVGHYMTNVMKTIPDNATVTHVANEFLNSTYKRFLVIDEEGKLVGQISRRDILRAIREMNVPNWNADMA